MTNVPDEELAEHIRKTIGLVQQSIAICEKKIVLYKELAALLEATAKIAEFDPVAAKRQLGVGMSAYDRLTQAKT